MQDLFINLTPVLADFIGLVLTLLITIVSYYIHRVTGIYIEQKHRDALHSALKSGVEAAFADGPKAGVDALVDAALAHAKQSVPDALKKLKPSAPVLRTLAGRYVTETMARNK